MVGLCCTLPSYLIRRNGILHFRMMVPRDVRQILGRCELKMSLRTGYVKDGRMKALRMASEAQRAFDEIRKGKHGVMAELTNDQIRSLVVEWLREALEEYEIGKVNSSKTVTEQDLENEEDMFSMMSADLREVLAKSDHKRRMGNFALELIREKGLEMTEDSQSFLVLCREMLKGYIQFHEVLGKRVYGDYSLPDKGDLFFPEVHYDKRPSLQISPQASQVPEEEVDHGPLLSEVLEDFVKDKMELGDWTEHTRMDNVPMINDFIEMVGDMPIGELSPQHMRDARDRFRKIPKNRRGNSRYEGKTLRGLSEMDIPEKERYSITTLNNRAIKIGGYLNWAKDRGYSVADGLATILRLKKTKRERKRASDDRAVFTPEDLARIFSPENYVPAVGGRSSRFWVPIISLCTGMRIEEICQLSLDDIREAKGVWCIDINGEGEKSFKTLASERLVPISPVLKDLGFLEYVDALKEQGDVRLFPDLTKAKTTGKYSHALSKWFNRYIHEGLNIREDDRGGKKVFHSFRHTLINRCKQLDLDTRKFKQAVGHEQGKDITLDHYGKDYQPDIIYRDVTCKATPQVDLSPLKEIAQSLIQETSTTTE